MSRPRFTVRGRGGMVVRSWRDVGKLGYGSGGAADSPWARQGIHVQGMTQAGTGGQLCKSTGGPGLPLERRNRTENPMLKTRHDFEQVGWLCLHCHMFEEGHDRLMRRLDGEEVDGIVTIAAVR